MRKFLGLGLILLLSSFCLAQSPQEDVPRWDYTPDEVRSLAATATQDLKHSIVSLKELADNSRNFDNTVLAFEKAYSDFFKKFIPLDFLKDVSTGKDLRDASAQISESAAEYMVDLFSDVALYDALKGQEPRNHQEERLKTKLLRLFESSGAALSATDRVHFRSLAKELAKLEIEFNTNVNDDNATELFTRDDLKGLSEEQLKSLNQDQAHNYLITTNVTDYDLVAKYAMREETRQRNYMLYYSRVKQNLDVLQKAVELRKQMATIMGFRSWAAFVLSDRLAETPEKVVHFQQTISELLDDAYAQEINPLRELKKNDGALDSELKPWDVDYYSRILAYKKFAYDPEKIAEYFPSDKVVSGIFQIYSKLFGVEFEEIKEHKPWAPGVKLYRLRDDKSGDTVAYFYTDTAPREGKYRHAAAYELRQGRMVGTTYEKPVAAIVANFTAPTKDKPSLLTIDEIVTFFHEFGHITHEILTEAPYASLSGINVNADFVEAPSQLLENWVGEPEVLKLLSGHYKNHDEKIPDHLLQNILAKKDFGYARNYKLLILKGLYDQVIHSENVPRDVNEAFHEMFEAHLGFRRVEGTNLPSSFGHMMEGSDSGYYTYLWSEAYSQDIFSRFQREGLFNPETGRSYRENILKPGDLQPGPTLLKNFLGRETNEDAFYEKLHIALADLVKNPETRGAACQIKIAELK